MRKTPYISTYNPGHRLADIFIYNDKFIRTVFPNLRKGEHGIKAISGKYHF